MIRTLTLSAFVLAFAGVVSFLLWHFRQRPEERAIDVLVPSVEVAVAKRETVPVIIPSQGVVEARTLTKAASEVAGKVMEVSSHLEVGGEFQEGDVLLRLDDSDYRAAAANARATLAKAKLALQVEEAKAEQSMRDWKKLGRRESPGPLVLREPQLASAKADLEAAEAELSKRELDLDRTILRAPYDGRVLRKHTDLASFVGMGAPLADFYKLETLEVRLPVSLGDLEFLDLGDKGVPVELSTSTGHRWAAELVRQESEVDRRSRSLHFVAAVRREASEAHGDTLLVPGLFVRARIDGKKLENVYRIPSRAMRDEKHLVIVRQDNTVEEREVEIVRREADSVLIASGLKDGERVCVSFLPIFRPEMKVEVIEFKEPVREGN